MSAQRKAIALISGGLDSMLAARVVMDQGVHVEGINFYTGFCVEGHTHAIRRQDARKNKRNNALWVAEKLGMRLHIVDIVEPYKDIVLNPKHGYGSHMNPCLDCKVFMVGQARAWIEQHGFDFIITGEVIGQRPMSQRRDTLPLISRGGCCFLTDASYARKLGDLWQSRGERRYELDDIMLLKVGRHLRPKRHFKLIIAREDGENRFLEGYRRQFTHLLPSSHPGPLTLVDGDLREEDLDLVAAIAARFGQGRDADEVILQLVPVAGEPRMLRTRPMASDAIPANWYV